jgi:lysozyme family protein
MNHFKEAFKRTMLIEGEGQRTNRTFDPGGDTYSGISRVYWPEWEGWDYLDKGYKKTADKLVIDFYRVNFWNRMQGGKLAEMAPELAYEVFDTAVHTGVHQAVKLMQVGYNVACGVMNGLLDDGLCGTRTLLTINKYLNTRPGSPELNLEILLNCMNGEQYVFYKNNPNLKRNRGWLRRV